MAVPGDFASTVMRPLPPGACDASTTNAAPRTIAPKTAATSPTTAFIVSSVLFTNLSIRQSVNPSIPDGHAIFSWIRPRRPAPWQLHDDLRTAKRPDAVRADVVPERAQRGTHALSDRWLDQHLHARHVPE